MGVPSHANGWEDGAEAAAGGEVAAAGLEGVVTAGAAGARGGSVAACGGSPQERRTSQASGASERGVMGGEDSRNSAPSGTAARHDDASRAVHHAGDLGAAHAGIVRPNAPAAVVRLASRGIRDARVGHERGGVGRRGRAPAGHRAELRCGRTRQARTAGEARVRGACVDRAHRRGAHPLTVLADRYGTGAPGTTRADDCASAGGVATRRIGGRVRCRAVAAP